MTARSVLRKTKNFTPNQKAGVDGLLSEIDACDTRIRECRATIRCLEEKIRNAKTKRAKRKAQLIAFLLSPEE